MGLSILGKGQACIDQPQNREIERKNLKKELQCLLSDSNSSFL